MITDIFSIGKTDKTLNNPTRRRKEKKSRTEDIFCDEIYLYVQFWLCISYEYYISIDIHNTILT